MASKNREAYFSNYKSQMRWKANREAKLLRQLKLQPGNEKQIELAIANMVYRRGTPKGRVWTSTMRKEAQLLKQFCGSAPLACWSSNPKIKFEAIAKLTKDFGGRELPSGRVDFSLGARAVNPAGSR